MKQTTTHLQDNMLFPLERTSLDPLDMDVENQVQDSAGQQAKLAEIDDYDRKLAQHFHKKIKLHPANGKIWPHDQL